MNCPSCFTNLTGNEKYCPHCGQYISKFNNNRKIAIIFGIIALSFAFTVILSPIGLILAIIGLTKAIKANKTNDSSLVIILNVVSIFFSFIALLILTLIFYIMINVSTHGDYYFPSIEDYSTKF